MDIEQACKAWGAALYKELPISAGSDAVLHLTRDDLMDQIEREQADLSGLPPHVIPVARAATTMLPEQYRVLFVHFVFPWHAKGDERHAPKWQLLFVGRTRYFYCLEGAMSHLRGALSMLEAS